MKDFSEVINLQRQMRFLIGAAYAAVLAGLLYLAMRYLLPWLLPFLIALALAAAMERPVQWIRRRTGLRRDFLWAVFTLALAAAVIAAIAVLTGQIAEQARQLLTALPALLSVLPTLADGIGARLEEMTAACPEALRQEVAQFLAQSVPRLSQLGASVSQAGMRLLGRAAAALPGTGLFLVTTVLATFFTGCLYPRLPDFFRRQVTPQQLARLQEIRSGAVTSLGRWLRSQATLLAVTFAELLTGFLLLRQPYALLLACLIALIDALPVLGTGTVLLPWAAGLCLLGSVPRALALLALYGVITVVRSVLEPKLVASQAGLPPLASLCAMYLGFRALGVGGMILCPIVLLLLKQLHSTGTLRLWK